MIPIDDLIEIWIKVHKEYSEKKVLALFDDPSLAWWGPALACLKPPPPDDETSSEAAAE
jgi:hypothetical protein